MVVSSFGISSKSFLYLTAWFSAHNTWSFSTISKNLSNVQKRKIEETSDKNILRNTIQDVGGKNEKRLTFKWIGFDQKSVNLQYNTLGRLDDGTNKSSTKRLMFQVLFFSMISCKILCKNPFNSFSYLFHKITKIKIKSFECPKSL